MSLDPITLEAFAAEMAKEASRLSSIGALMGPGAAIGGALGATGGAIRGYRQAKEEGSSGLVGGISGALSGGGTGAAAGAAVGGLVGAARPALGKKLIERAGTSDGALGSLTRFGQRQVHAVTGHGDINALRGGSYDAKKTLDKLKASGADAKSLASAQETYDAAQKGVSSGLTNLPGIVRGMARRPIETIKDTAKAHYAGTGNLGKAMMVAGTGLGVYDAAKQYQEGNVEGAAGSAAGTLAGLALSPIVPFVTSQTTSGLLSAGTRKAVGTLRKMHDKGLAHHPTESIDTQPAPEMHRTPSAAGNLNYDAGSA